MGNITKKRISYLGICLVILAILIFATYQNARPTSPEPNVIATATEVEGPSLKVEVESEETATPSLNVEVKSEETATPIPETPLTPISDISAREETPTATLAAVSLVEDKTSWTGRWVALDTTGGGGQMGIAPHPTNPDIVYIASDNAGLFKTENGGDRWFSVSSNLGAYRLGFVILDPLDPDIIYVTATSDFGHRDEGGGSGEMHRSLNGGLTWEFLTDAMGFQSSFPSQSSLVIPYDPDNPERFDKDGDNLSDVIVVGAWTGPADPL
jgi:hypothetical protein